MSKKAEVTYWLCGGCGINLGVHLKNNARTDVNKNARYVGLDASDANSSNGLFEIEHMTVAGKAATMSRGSGKKRATNYDQAEDFVSEALTKHKPSDMNVVVGSTSGGSGSILTTMVIRNLARKGLPFVVCFVSDFTSLVERNNAIATLRSTVAQTSQSVLGVPIPFLHFSNTTEMNRGDTNDEIVDRLNLLSLFLTEANEEADYEDIKNMLTYSKHYNVAPAFSQIRFFDQESAKAYQGLPPVAVYSLFETKNAIISRFSGSVVRTTGVFGKKAVKPENTEELHMTLDSGQYLEELSEQIQELNKVKAQVKVDFAQKMIDGMEDTDDNGMFLD